MNREYLKSKYTKFLLMILIAVFVLSSISGILFMTNKYNIINIDGNKIGINEFVNLVNYERQLAYTTDTSSEKLDFLNSNDFFLLTIDKAVNSRVIDMELKDFKLKKPENLIMDKIIKEPYFFTNGKFDIKKFHNLLKNFNITENQYIGDIQNRETIEFLFSTFINDTLINEKYIDNIFKAINSYKNVEIFKISKNKISIKQEKIDEEAIKKYYNNNVNKFIIPEQREINYIKIDNPKDEDIQKLEELLLISNNLWEIAKELKTNVKSYGYLSKNNLEHKNTEKISNLESAFDFNINDFSNIEKSGNDIFVFSVNNIKKEYIKNIKESKKEIIDLIKEENKEIEYRKFVNENIEKYKKSNYDNKILVNIGFSVENVDIYRTSENYNRNFVNDVLLGKEKSITKIYEDKDNLYFAYINSTKSLEKENKDFIAKDSIEESSYDSMAESLQDVYVSYLKNMKHKIKINYKLLDLIR